jgi:Tfp pilus assembly protein PilF
VHDTLGWIYLRRSEAAKGLAELEEAADLSPDNPTYRYHLAVAYSETGGVTNAREQLQQALASRKVFADRANAEQLAAKLDR